MQRDIPNTAPEDFSESLPESYLSWKDKEKESNIPYNRIDLEYIKWTIYEKIFMNLAGTPPPENESCMTIREEYLIAAINKALSSHMKNLITSLTEKNESALLYEDDKRVPAKELDEISVKYADLILNDTEILEFFIRF